jgi:ribosomal protein S18 acetylase RimI-like enzyme
VSTHHNSISLRDCREDDLPFLISLRDETMRPHILQSGIPFDRDREFQRVLYRLDCARIIIRNGTRIGLLKVVRDANPWELVQIQVAPEYQRCGIGSMLLTDLLAEARAAGVGVELIVLKQNPAKQLYERLGFCVTGTDDRIYRMRCP